MSSTVESRTAVGFIAHYFDPLIEKRFRKLVREAPPGFDVFLLVQEGTEVPRGLADRVYRFDFSKLRTMARAVIGESVWGNSHLRAIDFARRYPGYACMWFIEYDAIYTGHWRDFFRQFADDEADLLGAHMRYASKDPNFYWSSTLATPGCEAIGDRKLLGFFPVYRISARAVSALESRVAGGWVGFFEVILPTAVAHAGLTVSDIGDVGDFAPSARRRANYLSAWHLEMGLLGTSMRYAPPIAVPLVRNMLYHPCKTRNGRRDHALAHPDRKRLLRHPARAFRLALSIANAASISYLRGLKLWLHPGEAADAVPEHLPHTGHSYPPEGADVRPLPPF